jgi:hypothetical protein
MTTDEALAQFKEALNQIINEDPEVVRRADQHKDTSIPALINYRVGEEAQRALRILRALRKT